AQQAGRAEEGHRLDPHHLERVDLVGDPHRPKLGDDPGPDLGREDVAEGVGQPLTQVAVGGEEACERGSADRTVEVGALETALEAEDEAEGKDDQGRAEDQDARLAQSLAEELEDPTRVDETGDPDAEAGDIAEGVEPGTRGIKPADHRTACRSGLVARRIELTTNW